MKKIVLLLIILMVFWLLPSCGKRNKNFNQNDKENIYAQIELSTGDKINLRLYYEYAPISVDRFVQCALDEFYDNTIFHRIIDNFMIQGGGYTYNGGQIKAKGGYSTIFGEFSNNGWTQNKLKHTTGTISFARSDVNDSATTQFFICSTTKTSLDGKYAAFGRCTDDKSRNVVVKLAAVATYSYSSAFTDFPKDTITIKAVYLANEVFK